MKQTLLAIILVPLLALLVACTATAQGPTEERLMKLETQLTRLQAEVDIASIASCFGRTQDILGTNPGGGIEEAKTLLDSCHTSDATFVANFPGMTEPVFNVQGTDAFVGLVRQTFDHDGYIATRHLMGNIDIIFTSDTTATLISQTVTPHYINGTGTANDNTVDFTSAWFEDEVVLTDGVWKSKAKTLNIDAFWRGVGVAPPTE